MRPALMTTISKWRLLLLAAALAGSGYVMLAAEDGPRFGPGPGPRTTASGRHHEEGQLSPEDKAKLMAFAKDNAPELYEKLTKLDKDDTVRSAILMNQVYRLYQSVQEYPPEVRPAVLDRHRLNVAIFHALRDFRAADTDAKREEAKKQIQTLLGQQFDNEQIVREYDIKRLAKQLEDLKAQVEQNKNNRQGVIADRLNRLLTRPPTSRPGDPD